MTSEILGSYGFVYLPGIDGEHCMTSEILGSLGLSAASMATKESDPAGLAVIPASDVTEIMCLWVS